MLQLPQTEKFYLEAYSPSGEQPTVYAVTEMKEYGREVGRGTTPTGKHPRLSLTLDDGSVLIISSDKVYL